MASWEAAMTVQSVPLKVVEAPGTGYAIQAPPPITVSAHTNHYLCGHCGTLLVIADEGDLRGLVVQCRDCGYYNQVP
jgi:DNA-directed RNA polymerase subunit RPC12/RpoP